MSVDYHVVLVRAGPQALQGLPVVLPDEDVMPSSGNWPLAQGADVVFKFPQQREWPLDQWGTYVCTLSVEQCEQIEQSR